MRNLSSHIAQVLLISVFAAPTALLAADPDPHHPDRTPSVRKVDPSAQTNVAEIHERMQTRMLAMRNTGNPQARQDMMLAQMQDMMSMMQMMGSGCPMMGGQGGMMGNMMDGTMSK